MFLTSEEARLHWDELQQSNTIIFGAPTHTGSASAEFKAFMDATSKPFSEGAWKDRIAAGFTKSASRAGDKFETLIQFAILTAQHGMHWVNLGLPPANNSSKGSEVDLNRLGFYLGPGGENSTSHASMSIPDEPRYPLRFQKILECFISQRVGKHFESVLGMTPGTVAKQAARARTF